MLAPLTILSLDQGKLYGSKPTIDEIRGRMASDLGLQHVSSGDPTATPGVSWLSRLRERLERARGLQPKYQG